MKMLSHPNLLLGSVLAAFLGSAPAWATDYDLELLGGTGNTTTWSAANWNPAGTPGASDTVNITGNRTAESYLRLNSATTSVDTFNFVGGLNTFINTEASVDRTFNIGTLNFNPNDGQSATLRFQDLTAKDPGLLTLNIGTLNVNADVQGRTLSFGTLTGPSGQAIIKSLTVTTTNIQQGTLSIGAVRQSVADPLNVNLGNVTLTGASSLLNLSASLTGFSNVVLMESLAGSGGQILPGSFGVEGTVQISLATAEQERPPVGSAAA